MSVLLHPGRQLAASFHAELYKLVPEGHVLRKIHAAVNFGFIQEIVEQSYCKYYGRPANEPELLFRLLFLQILYNLSDERMIQEAQVNLAYKWFIGSIKRIHCRTHRSYRGSAIIDWEQVR